PGPPPRWRREVAVGTAQRSLSARFRPQASAPASPPPVRAPASSQGGEHPMTAVRPGRPAQVDNPTAAPAQVGTATAAPARHGRLRDAAARRGVPLATILVTVAVVVLTYLAGKLAYRIRDVLLMIAVAGFVSLILNPLVVALQRWGIRRRGWAVTLVAAWTVVVFIGLLAAFGYPLAHGVTHFSQRLPSYV